MAVSWQAVHLFTKLTNPPSLFQPHTCDTTLLQGPIGVHGVLSVWRCNLPYAIAIRNASRITSLLVMAKILSTAASARI